MNQRRTLNDARG